MREFRTELMSVRLTPDEKKKLKDIAQSRNKGPSTFTYLLLCNYIKADRALKNMIMGDNADEPKEKEDE